MTPNWIWKCKCKSSVSYTTVLMNRIIILSLWPSFLLFAGARREHEYCVTAVTNEQYSLLEWKFWLFNRFVWFFSMYFQRDSSVPKVFCYTLHCTKQSPRTHRENTRKKTVGNLLLIVHRHSLADLAPIFFPSYLLLFVECTLFVISYRTNTFLSSIKKRLKWSFFLVFSQCLCGDCFVKWSV